MSIEVAFVGKAKGTKSAEICKLVNTTNSGLCERNIASADQRHASKESRYAFLNAACLLCDSQQNEQLVGQSRVHQHARGERR